MEWACQLFGHWWRPWGPVLSGIQARSGPYVVREELGVAHTCRLCGRYEEELYDDLPSPPVTETQSEK
jgi:hypothetical protein